MPDTGPCEYCTKQAPVFIEPPEAAIRAHVCKSCLKLLRNPATALPLIRGNLTLQLRGSIPESRLSRMVDVFMGELASLQPKTVRS